MPEFPIMATDDEDVIHRIGYDEGGEAWTACGIRAGTMAAILAYNPTCPQCIEPALNDGSGTPQ
jgi:hypothetical protein